MSDNGTDDLDDAPSSESPTSNRDHINQDAQLDKATSSIVESADLAGAEKPETHAAAVDMFLKIDGPENLSAPADVGDDAFLHTKSENWFKVELEDVLVSGHNEGPDGNGILDFGKGAPEYDHKSSIDDKLSAPGDEGADDTIYWSKQEGDAALACAKGAHFPKGPLVASQQLTAPTAESTQDPPGVDASVAVTSISTSGHESGEGKTRGEEADPDIFDRWGRRSAEGSGDAHLDGPLDVLPDAGAGNLVAPQDIPPEIGSDGPRPLTAHVGGGAGSGKSNAQDFQVTGSAGPGNSEDGDLVRSTDLSPADLTRGGEANADVGNRASDGHTDVLAWSWGQSLGNGVDADPDFTGDGSRSAEGSGDLHGDGPVDDFAGDTGIFSHGAARPTVNDADANTVTVTPVNDPPIARPDDPARSSGTRRLVLIGGGAVLLGCLLVVIARSGDTPIKVTPVGEQVSDAATPAEAPTTSPSPLANQPTTGTVTQAPGAPFAPVTSRPEPVKGGTFTVTGRSGTDPATKAPTKAPVTEPSAESTSPATKRPPADPSPVDNPPTKDPGPAPRP